MSTRIDAHDPSARFAGTSPLRNPQRGGICRPMEQRSRVRLIAAGTIVLDFKETAPAKAGAR